MDFGLTEDEKALQGLAREILADRVTHAHQVEVERAGGEAAYDEQTWRQLAAAGLVGAALPEAVGGGGVGLIALGLLAEEVGRAAAHLPVGPLAYGALTVARHGSAAQQQALLGDVAAGRGVMTTAFAEPGETEPTSPSATASPDGSGGYTVTGEKVVVPWAAQASRVLVPATSPDGVVVLLVDPRARGATLTPVHVTSHEPHANLSLDGAGVGAADVLAGPDRGVEVVHDAALHGATVLACRAAGLCDGALRMTATYTANRKQFGKPIASFQAVGQRAADAYVDTEMIRLTAYQALWRLSAGWPADDEVAVAKFWAADGGYRVVQATQHLHGGIGVDLDYPVHRYFLQVKQVEHTLGHGTRQLLTLGRSLAAQPV